MLGKQNNLAEVLPVQMESGEKWSVNICLCSLRERWRFNWLHKHRVISAISPLNSCRLEAEKGPFCKDSKTKQKKEKKIIVCWTKKNKKKKTLLM